MDTGYEVFFLYPPNLMRDQLVDIIVQAEYELYLLRDHNKAPRLLAGYPGSILFVNIDEKIRGGDWENWLRELMQAPQTSSVRVGVVSQSSDPQLVKRYVKELSVPCGFIRLKSAVEENARMLLSVLSANQARGQRKYVRVEIAESSRVTFNVRSGRDFQRGWVRDISVVGMACYFDNPVSLKLSDPIADLQLRLRGRLLALSGTVAGVRQTESGTLYVIMFAPRTEGIIQQQLHGFIHETLQSKMNAKLQSL